MDLAEVLQIGRRRWLIIVVGAVVGMAAGFATAPGADGATRDYRSVSTLIGNPTRTWNQRPATQVSLGQAALLVTTGDVPRAVAAEMELALDDVTRAVEAEVDQDASALSITVTDESARLARERSRRLAKALSGHLADGDRQQYERTVEQASREVESLRDDIDRLTGIIERDGGVGDPDDVSARERARQQLSVASTTLRQLKATGPPTPILLIVDTSAPQEVEPGLFQLPVGKVPRSLLFGVVGLALGAAAAAVFDRLDTRIKSKEAAEAAFGVPVLAEVPRLTGGRKFRYRLHALDDPTTGFMESYRALRTTVSIDLGSASGGGAREPDGAGRIVVVVSAGPNEGKTTSVAHLGAALAEVGKSVLLISADFRRPRLHSFFDVPREPGLVDVLSEPDPALKDLVRPTNYPGVRMIASGAPVSNPAPLLAAASDLLVAAREVFDFVIVDTAPLLVANDASEFVATADTVVVIARSGRTTTTAAQRSMELMERLGVKALGVVLVAAKDTPTSYYRYRYYSEDLKRRDRRRRTATNA